MHYIVYWLRCLALIACLASGTPRLLHVGLVFRHGHRSPIHLLPNDSYTVANTWRDGLGQLTNLGRRNQFELGSFLRGRYNSFLGPRYNSSEHYIRSSDIDRTLMSAQACLAGLFPPTGDQSWLPGLMWQPIPVHTVRRTADELLLPGDHDGCASSIAQLSEAPRRSADRLRVVTESDEFLRRLSVLVQRPLQLDTLYQVTDNIMVLSAANLTLPAWARVPETAAKLESLGRFSWRMFAWTPELRRMRIGVLLDSLLARLEHVTANRMPSNGGRRLTIYSGHDITITPLLAALGNEDFVWPSFAACVMFELHSTAQGQQPVVRIFFRNDTRREPLPIRVPGCDVDCPLDRLAGLLARYRISADQFRGFCRSSGAGATVERRSTLAAVSYGLFGAAAALLVAALLAFAYLRCVRNNAALQSRDERPSVAYHSLLGSVEN